MRSLRSTIGYPRIMSEHGMDGWLTPRERDLGLRRICNDTGICISVLPNGSIFAIEHRSGRDAILVNQLLASPIHGGIGRFLLRTVGLNQSTIDALGPRAK